MTDYSPSHGDRMYHAEIIDIPVHAVQQRGLTTFSTSSEETPSESTAQVRRHLPCTLAVPASNHACMCAWDMFADHEPSTCHVLS